MNPPGSQPAAGAAWRPPSESLRLHEGIWVTPGSTSVSYPDAGNDACFQVEDDSYWFRHRADCILAALMRLPPAGLFLDVGGGNGQVAAAIQNAGHPVVLLEPGHGAHNAVQRGLAKVIQATFSEAKFFPGSLDAAGAFDVIEHIEEDAAFLQELHGVLKPGGRFYCTVPAGTWLWSADDVAAGHYRRYTTGSLARRLRDAGFSVEYLTPFFTWLAVPVFALRTVPSRLGGRKAESAASAHTIKTDHRMPPALQRIIAPVHAWERQRISAGRTLPGGTSLLCVARRRD